MENALIADEKDNKTGDNSHHNDIKLKKKEAKEARQEAKTSGIVGAVGAVFGLGLEAFELVEGIGEGVAIAKEVARHARNNVKATAFVAGTIGVGALIYAGIRHSHAHDIEEEIRNKEAANSQHYR